MFYDLNIPWSANDSNLTRTLTFLHELGYTTIALNHTLTGKLPSDLICPIPTTLPNLPSNLTLLRRCTLTLTDSHSNARLAQLAQNYDLLAVRPIDEKTLQQACTALESVDLISLDLTVRLPFWFKHKLLHEAVKAGKRFEISYASALHGDANARRNLISNAAQLIRASRGRGVVISSEATTAVAARGPWDVVNLAAVWGLGQERGFEAVSGECRSLVVGARLKRNSYRGVVDVIYGGEKAEVKKKEKEKDADAVNGKAKKRKAEVLDANNAPVVSKRQMKRQQHAAREAAKLENASGGAENGEKTETIPKA